MSTPSDILADVREALDAEPRVDMRECSLHMGFDRDVLTLEGQVASVAIKKLVLERAAAVPAVSGIVDRLRVMPGQPMGDAEVREHVRNALLQESALREIAIGVRDGERTESIRAPDKQRGSIEISVADGVVTLDGEVPSLSHKRLAGVLAWWVPGSRDVINGLGVEPPEEDNDDEVTDAVRLILEKDPFVDASRIRVSTRDYAVTLEGLVPTAEERNMAVFDSWYVFGVDDVVIRIQVG